jgi:hypothetical protein
MKKLFSGQKIVLGSKNCYQVKKLFSGQKIVLRSKNCSQVKKLFSGQGSLATNFSHLSFSNITFDHCDCGLVQHLLVSIR